MTIISMSINDKLLSELDLVQKNLGFSGRSEVLRAALRLFLSEHSSVSSDDIDLEAVLVVIHNEANIHDLKHDYSKIIKTQVHNHINGRCLELFVVSGNNKVIQDLVLKFRKLESVELVKLIHN